MKIGIITDETDTSLLGLGTYALNITKQILSQDKKNKYLLVHRRKENHDIYKMAGEKIIPSPPFPLSSLRNFVTLPLKLRKYKLDLVHHTSSVGPFVFKQFLPGHKNVQTVLDIIPLIHPETYELPVRVAFKHLLPHVIKNTDHIFAGSETSKTDIVNYFKIKENKVTVTYLAPHERFRQVDKKRAKLFIKTKYKVKDPFILYVGALEAKKNLPILINAFAKLKQAGIEHKLVLAGKKGYGYNKIEEEIKKHKLQNSVYELGQLPNAYEADDLVMLYNAADVFVFPSIYEGFGMPAIEAMKCGCPVVSSTGGSLKEVVGKGGLTVRHNDSEGFTNFIRNILDKKRVRDDLRAKGFENAKRFSWKESAKKTIAGYNKL